MHVIVFFEKKPDCFYLSAPVKGLKNINFAYEHFQPPKVFKVFIGHSHIFPVFIVFAAVIRSCQKRKD